LLLLLLLHLSLPPSACSSPPQQYCFLFCHCLGRRSGIGIGSAVAATAATAAAAAAAAGTRLRGGLGGRGLLNVVICFWLLPGLGLFELLVRGFGATRVLNIAGPALK